MAAPRVEIESTYEFPPVDASRVIEWLDVQARRGLAVDGANLALREISRTRRVYLYLRPAMAHSSDRLIADFVDGVVTARRSLKHSELVDDQLLKFHDRDSRSEGLTSWLDLLRDRPVIAGLLKVQRRYRFRGAPQDRVKIGVAALVPFHPVVPSRTGEPFCHIEIEATNRGLVTAAMAAMRAGSDAFIHLRPLRGSKQQHAAQFEQEAFALVMGSESELLRYIHAAESACEARVGDVTGVFLG